MSLNAICVEKRNSALEWFSLAPRKVRLLTNASLRVQAPWQVQPGEGQERWRVHAVLIKRTLAVTLT